MTLDAMLRWKKHVKENLKVLGLKYKKIYWLLGRRSTLSIYNKLVPYKEILRTVLTYDLQLLGFPKHRNLTSFTNFKTSYLGTSMMKLGISETATYIRTFR
jgi:hypothetical protein